MDRGVRAILSIGQLGVVQAEHPQSYGKYHLFLIDRKKALKFEYIHSCFKIKRVGDSLQTGFGNIHES